MKQTCKFGKLRCKRFDAAEVRSWAAITVRAGVRMVSK